MMSHMPMPAMRGPASSRLPGMPGLSIARPSPATVACPRAAAAADLPALTPRERDILPYLVSGKSNKYIAIELSISSRTAEAHRAHILRKMGVRSTMELACRLCPHRRARE